MRRVRALSFFEFGVNVNCCLQEVRHLPGASWCRPASLPNRADGAL